MRVGANVGVGPCRVVGAAVGQAEGVPVHCGRDVGLGSPVGEVSIPLLVAGTKVLHLQRRRRKRKRKENKEQEKKRKEKMRKTKKMMKKKRPMFRYEHSLF